MNEKFVEGIGEERLRELVALARGIGDFEYAGINGKVLALVLEGKSPIDVEEWKRKLFSVKDSIIGRMIQKSIEEEDVRKIRSEVTFFVAMLRIWCPKDLFNPWVPNWTDDLLIIEDAFGFKEASGCETAVAFIEEIKEEQEGRRVA